MINRGYLLKETKMLLRICPFLLMLIRLHVDAYCSSAITAQDIDDAAQISKQVYSLKEGNTVTLTSGLVFLLISNFD